ncbi:MAG: protein kinase [Acidobacteriota bacterium]
MVEKIGPYRVYERLGVGGMGEVYKAYDDRLDRWVAIKRIRPDREDAEDNRERFKREARATARLNHPSIVHLYGIFQEGDSDCIVMEYVEGPTLDKVLKEGALDPLRVANLGHEIAAGLAEAHANGILHRDLKAENIIITRKGRAKILDFGLAKPILNSELDPVLTGKGQLVGTSRAMSPEYVSGEKVDHRSDLFALGVLLYECLTGQSPFKAHNTLATLKQVMLFKPPPVKQINGKVPPELSDLIDRLLAKEPKDRPQSAHEVSLAFGRLTGQISSGAIDSPDSPLPGTSSMTPFSASDTVLDLRRRRKWLPALLLLVAVVGVAFFAGRFLQGPDDGIIPGSRPDDLQILLVLGDFQNTTGEETLGQSFAELLRASLGQSRSITVQSRSQIRETLERMQQPVDSVVDRDLGIEVAQRENADRLVLGSISSFGTSYSLVTEVVDPQNGDTKFSDQEQAKDVGDIQGAIQDLAQGIRQHLGESLAEIERTQIPLEKVTTPNIEALKLYTVGVDRLANLSPAEAVPLLQKAVQLDPGFAMAHAKLGVGFKALGDQESAIQHLDLAEANRERLSELEQFYVDGWLAWWRGRANEVIEAWALMGDVYPGNEVGHTNLGFAYIELVQDFRQAAEAFAKAESVASDSSTADIAELLSSCYLALGEWDTAEAYLEPLEDKQSTRTRWFELLLVRREYPAAELLLARIPEAESSPKRALLLVDRGALDEALALIDSILLRQAEGGVTGSAVFGASSDKASVLFHLGDDGLLPFLDELVAAAPKYLAIDGLGTRQSSFYLLVDAAKIYARVGEVERAQAVLDLLKSKSTPPAEAVPIWRHLLLVVEGEIALAQGAAETALTRFQQALDITDSVDARESIGRAHQSLGSTEAAIEHYEWLIEHRGRAFVEGRQVGHGVAKSVITWALAHENMGKLLEELGEKERATESYRRFVEHWRLADADSPALVDAAKARIAALTSGG